MRIDENNYNYLKEEIDKVIKTNPNMAKNYKKNGLSKTRYIWDLFHKTLCYDLYNCLNDSHIQTALNKIVSDY